MADNTYTEVEEVIASLYGVAGVYVSHRGSNANYVFSVMWNTATLTYRIYSNTKPSGNHNFDWLQIAY